MELWGWANMDEIEEKISESDEEVSEHRDQHVGRIIEPKGKKKELKAIS